MCLAVYLGSSVELPQRRWDRSAPAFHLETVEPGDEVRRQFSLPNVYYAGSHSRCGCGFLKEGAAGDELEICQANYQALAETIRDAQQRGARIELFSCWEGQQSAKPDYTQSLDADGIEDPSFQFKEGHYIRVT